MKFLRNALLGFLLLSAPAVANAQITNSKVISTSGADCSTETACAVFGVYNMPSIGLYVNVGTSGTFNFEASIDGTTWFSVNDDINAASSVTADGARFFTNPGYAYIRVRASAISGNATVISQPGYSGLKSTATLSGAAQGDGTILDGANATIKSTVFDLANSNPLTTAIVDASGNQITSFGGGTQYANASAQATPTGTVALGYDGANVRALLTDTSGNQKIVFASAQSVNATQTGTWSVRNQDGSGNLLTSATRGTERALSVQIVDGSGAQITSFGGSGGTASNVGSAVPAQGTAAGFSDGTNMQLARVFDVDTGAGTQYTQGVELRAAASGGSVALAGASAANAIPVRMTIDGSSFATSADVTHDAALTLASNPGPLQFGRASAAAPTDVSADNDAVVAWMLRSGATVMQPSYGGVLASTGNGTAGTGTPRVTIASDNTAFSVNAVQSGTWTVQPGNTANTTPWLVRRNDTTNSELLDACATVAPNYTPINISTATTTRVIAPTSAKKTFICSLVLFSAGTNNVGIVEGTGGTCGTGTAGVIGGTTAASGLNLTAQTGIAWGNGASSIAATAGTNVDFCLITSAAVQLTGHIKWVAR